MAHLNPPAQYVNQGFPLQVFGKLAKVRPLARERLSAIRILLLLDLASPIVPVPYLEYVTEGTR
jgi:hypothetical protein